MRKLTKTIITMVAALSMVFAITALAGCGSQNNDTNATGNTTNENTVVSTNTNSADEKSDGETIVDYEEEGVDVSVVDPDNENAEPETVYEEDTIIEDVENTNSASASDSASTTTDTSSSSQPTGSNLK